MRHLQQGGTIPIENLPLLRESSGTIIRFSISYERYKEYYNFEKPFELIENFFSTIDLRFDADGAQEYIIKCSFCIRNYQPLPEDVNNAVGLYDKRFWSTETYNGKFFNEYIKISLTYDIKKRIITNVRTGSSWRFNRFEYISTTFNTIENQKVSRY